MTELFETKKSEPKKKRKTFCQLDYEHVQVIPFPDGSNNMRIHTTKKYKLQSATEWISVTCDDMKEIFIRLQTFKTAPEKAKLAMDSFRDALESSFAPEVYELPRGPKQNSFHNKKLESEEDQL